MYGAGQGLTRKRFASGWSGDPMFLSGLRVSGEMEMDEYHCSEKVSVRHAVIRRK